MKDQTQEARDYLCSLDQFSYYTNYINRTETGLAGDFAYDLVKYLKSLPQPEITQADMDKALKERDTAIVDEWMPEDTAPDATPVLVWLHLPKNPLASSYAIGTHPYVVEDEPESYGEFRRTVGCWWINGRYCRRNSDTGYVTHWMPLPKPPSSEAIDK